MVIIFIRCWIEKIVQDAVAINIFYYYSFYRSIFGQSKNNIAKLIHQIAATLDLMLWA